MHVQGGDADQYVNICMSLYFWLQLVLYWLYWASFSNVDEMQKGPFFGSGQLQYDIKGKIRL